MALKLIALSLFSLISQVLLTPENTPADCPKEWYEIYFVFAAVWAFGGAMFQDQVKFGTVCGTCIFVVRRSPEYPTVSRSSLEVVNSSLLNIDI